MPKTATKTKKSKSSTATKKPKTLKTEMKFTQPALKAPEPKKEKTFYEEEELAQRKFTILTNRRFICLIPGIDAFLVKKVFLPPYEANKKNNTFAVFLHNVVSPSTRQQVWEISRIYDRPKTVELHYLDALGTIISKTRYVGCVVERVDYPNPDYDDNSPLSEIKVTFGYQTEIMDY